jgi:hypothetical protein
LVKSHGSSLIVNPGGLLGRVIEDSMGKRIPVTANAIPRDATIDAGGAAFGESPNVVARPARDNDLSPVSELVLIEPAKASVTRIRWS